MRASPSLVRCMALRREGIASQYAAAKLLEVSGEARYELAGLMIRACDRVDQACTALSFVDSPLVLEVWAGCQQISFLCEYWREWFDQAREMPLEFCIPEPTLLPLPTLPSSRPGTVPPHVARVNTAIDTLRTLVTMDMFYNHHTQFFANLAMLEELSTTGESLGTLLAWPLLIAFSSDLSRLVRRRRLETISASVGEFPF